LYYHDARRYSVDTCGGGVGMVTGSDGHLLYVSGRTVGNKPQKRGFKSLPGFVRILFQPSLNLIT